MVYKYITNIDKKINDTLNIYSEIGRLSIPIVKYLVVIVSFLIFTSCFALLYTGSRTGTGTQVPVRNLVPVTHFKIQEQHSSNNYFQMIIFEIRFSFPCSILQSCSAVVIE